MLSTTKKKLKYILQLIPLQQKPIKLSTSLAQTPRIGFMISVIQWPNSFLPLSFAHICSVCKSAKSRSKLNQPSWVDHGDLPHVLPACHHQFVIHHPIKSLKDRTAAMDIHRLILD